MTNLKWFYLLLAFLIWGGCKSVDIHSYQEPKAEINSNNIIYTKGTEIIFDYYFIHGQDTLKCMVLSDLPTYGSFWEMVNVKDMAGQKNVVDKIQLNVTGGTFANQTKISFFLLYPSLVQMKDTWTGTGLIENKHRVWTHPNRMYGLEIVEFSPFPEIRFPLKKGTTWTSTISPGPNPSYNQWIKFDKTIDCVSTYKITEKTQLKTKIGTLKCFITKATAVNPISKNGYLTSYFNPEYGFVKLEYINIDGNRLVMEVVDFKKN